jgi:tetratricopeptide (TPR) repeat protein
LRGPNTLGTWQSVDPDERAGFCRELAEVRLAEGRLEEALALFERAACLFEDIGQIDDQVEAWLAEGDLSLLLWDYESALECFERIAFVAPDGIDVAAIFRAAKGAATAWMEQGRPNEARAVLQDMVAPYIPRATALQRAEILWTEARISVRCNTGEAPAEAQLWQALAAFLDLSQPLCAASVALDLAELYLTTSRAEGLHRAVALFGSLASRPDLPQEARDALSSMTAEEAAGPLQPRLAALARRLARWRREPAR